MSFVLAMMKPASPWPVAVVSSHRLIAWEAKLLGASAVVVDRPTGERNSSPTVWMTKTTARNHHGARSPSPIQVWNP